MIWPAPAPRAGRDRSISAPAASQARWWALVGGTGTTIVNMILKQPWDKPCPEERYVARAEADEWLERLCRMGLMTAPACPACRPRACMASCRQG